MATAIVAVLDPLTLQLSYATAGHPAPVLALPGHPSSATLPTGGGPLGYMASIRTPSWKVTLAAGALLVLYTDGLIEQTRDVIEGQEAVVRASHREIAAPSGNAAQGIVAAVLGGLRALDDVAVITLAVDPAPFDRFDLTLPAEPASAAVIRQTVRRLAQVAALNETREVDLTIAVGEAVNNAIEHAYRAAGGTVRVLGVRDAGEIRVTVVDSGTWRSARAPDGGGRGLALIRELADSFKVEQTASGTTVAIAVRVEGGDSGSRTLEDGTPRLDAAGDGQTTRAGTGGALPASPAGGAGPGSAVATVSPVSRERPVASGVRLLRGADERLPVVEPFGDLDASTLEAVGQALADASREEIDAVIVSLERARYIDSLTIRRLFEVGRNLGTQRRAMALVVPADAPLARIVTVAGLAAQYPVFGSVADARAAFKEGNRRG
jgi:anti-anti-sigma factor